MSYPLTRCRRIRQATWCRDLVAETHISAKDLIFPIFIQEGGNIRTPISTMPGVDVLSIDLCVEQAKKAYDCGINAMMLFPKIDPQLKSVLADEAYNPKNLICRAIAAIKKAVPEIGIITDIALDPYTSHGHDGILTTDGKVDNDKTILILAKQGLSLAEAGCDALAPSDMMDGRILRIRELLEDHRLHDMLLISYAAKYASSFYGPFRNAIGSSDALKQADKKSYQMDPANIKEAILEASLDISEGADMLIIKPAMPYLDVINTVSNVSKIPVIGYQVSGEYSMIKFAALHGAIDYNKAQKESLLACKRAGACAVITYAALEMAMSWE